MAIQYDFNDTNALVFGGSSGIGRAVALELEKGGANVVAISRTPDSALFEGTNIRLESCDVTDRGAMKQLVDKLASELKTFQVVVNCAGTEMALAPLHEADAATINAVLSTNLLGMIHCMQLVIPVLLKSGGAIVNVSSVAGLKGFPGGAVYAASKAAVCMLSRSAAMEYVDKGLRINCVAPGMIETPMTSRLKSQDPSLYEQMVASMPLGRAGTPEEAASAILWLCSDEASFVNGETIVVDSGYLA